MIPWTLRSCAFFSILLLSLISCNTETNFYSENTFSNDIPVALERNSSPERITYMSTISDLLATFPKFNNAAINKEISELKQNLTGYLNAIRYNNSTEKEGFIKKFECNYKGIQVLRKKLDKEEDQVLNRYLVNIKTNVNLLEAVEKSHSKTSTNTN